MLARRFTQDPEAYHDYLKGRFHWNKRSVAGLNEGIGYFRRALEKDPAYALAYVGLADSYNILGFYNLLPPGEAFPKAEAAARKALEIDPDLAEAYTSLGYATHYYRWAWEEAERYFLKAIELKESYPTAHHFYANQLIAQDRHEKAVAELRRALELDPFSLIMHAALGFADMFARRFDTACRKLEKTLELDANFGLAHLWLSWVLVLRGEYQRAADEARNAVTIFGSSSESLFSEAYAWAAAGEHDRARELLDRLMNPEDDSFVQPYSVAVVYAALGEIEDSVPWLERAVAIRSHMLTFLAVDPRLDAVRAHPRFTQVLSGANLS